jgi:hypothetical protein
VCGGQFHLPNNVIGLAKYRQKGLNDDVKIVILAAKELVQNKAGD